MSSYRYSSDNGRIVRTLHGVREYVLSARISGDSVVDVSWTTDIGSAVVFDDSRAVTLARSLSR